MTTKPEATAPDALESDGRSTDPGLGAASDAPPAKSAKQFDPRRYQANTMPPGLRSVVIGTELPSMPRNRIEDTMPPMDAQEALGEAVPEPVARPLKAIPVRLAVPLGILIFAAGALVVLLVARGYGQRAHVEGPAELDVGAAPQPVASIPVAQPASPATVASPSGKADVRTSVAPGAVDPTVVPVPIAPTVVVRPAPGVSAVVRSAPVVSEPVTQPRPSASAKIAPRAAIPPESAEPKPRVRNEDPE